MTCAQKRGSKKLFFAFSNGDAIVNRFNRFSLMVWCLAGCLSVPCGKSSKTDVQTWIRSTARTASLRRPCGRNVKLWKRISMVRHFRTVHAVSSWREPIDLGRLVLGVHFKSRCWALTDAVEPSTIRCAMCVDALQCASCLNNWISIMTCSIRWRLFCFCIQQSKQPAKQDVWRWFVRLKSTLRVDCSMFPQCPHTARCLANAF